MPQQIVYTDEKEDAVIVRHSRFWKISKAETIKKIIKDYGKTSKITFIFLCLFIFLMSSGSAQQENVSLQYVWNESCTEGECWVPWIADNTGKPKVDLNLLNITAENASLADSLIVNYIFPYTLASTILDNITISKDVHILGTLYGGSPLLISGDLNLSGNLTLIDDSILADYIYSHKLASTLINNLSITNDVFASGNISSSDSINSDYLFPKSASFTRIDNVTINQDLRVLGSSYLSSFTIGNDLLVGSNNISSTFVGLGTFSPEYLLHLNISNDDNESVTPILTLEKTNLSTGAGDGYGSSILFRLADDTGEMENASMISGILEDVSNGTERGALVFYTGYGDVNGIISNLSLAEAMRITGAGNIGIGTTSPGSKLTVVGNVNFTGTVYADNYSSNSPIVIAIDGSDEIVMNSSNVYPATNSGNALGSSSNAWSNAYIDNAGTVTWNYPGLPITASGDAGTLSLKAGSNTLATFANGGASTLYYNTVGVAATVGDGMQFTSGGNAVLYLDAAANLASFVYFEENNNFRYFIGYNADDNAFYIRTSDSDGGGTDAYIVRIPDGQETVDFTSTVDQNAFDYAEYMPKLNVEDKFERADVVGIKEGKVTHNTENAELFMVVTTNPATRGGNAPFEMTPEQEKEYYKTVIDIAFIGQVPVKVSGEAKPGDYLLPSGNNDGTAIAISPNNITFQQYRKSLGIILNKFTPPENARNSIKPLYKEMIKKEQNSDYNLYLTAVGVK